MTVRERQERRGNTPHGRNLVNNATRPSTPIRDVPLTGNLPDPETGLFDDDQHNVPLNAEMVNAQTQHGGNSFDEIPDAESAARLARLLQTKGRDAIGEAAYDKGMIMLRSFASKNPGQAEAAAKEAHLEQWRTDNIDTTPHVSSRLINAQRDASFDNVVGFMPDSSRVPQSKEDLRSVPKDSYEGVVDKLEQEGYDTTSGIGGFWDNVGLAVKLNDSAAQAKAITGVALDNLEAAGIQLPEGVQPITVNPELGQLVVLMPTADGKVRRTLVEPEVFNMAGAGRLADLEELFAGIYAATSVVRAGPGAKHPFVRELLGDFAGRNVGIMLESMISGAQGEADLADIANAFSFKGNITESGLNTAVSRGLARAGQTVTGARKAFGSKFSSGSETADIVNRNIDEAADTLTDINKLVEGSDEVLPFTVESGSLSQRSAQKVNARVNTLNVAKAEGLEVSRRERAKTLAEANRRVAEKHAPADGMSYDAHEVVGEAAGTVNTARQVQVDTQRAKLGQVKVRENPHTGLTRYSFRGETDKAVQGEGEVAGEHGVDVLITDDNVHVVNAFAGEKFEGATNRLFNQILEDAGDRTVTMADSASPSAQKTVEGMRRRGWVIETNPRAVVGADGHISTPTLEPVYTLVARPGEIVAPKLIADATFDREITEATVEGIEDLLPIAQGRADDANYLLKEQIGWSEQRHSSNFYVDNPRTSGLRAQVRRLQAKVDNVLTGAEASEAERQLAVAVRKEVDEEGDVLLTGLASDQLDLGNLLNSRARLAQIAKDTGDPDMAAIVNTMDNLLANKAYINRGTGRARPAQTATIRESYQRARTMQGELDEITAVTNASKLFKRNVDGQLINTDLNAMGRILSNGSAFLTHMLPVIKRGPDLASGARGAISDLYRKEVLERASGWSASAHARFLRKYDTAINNLYDDEAQGVWRSFRPTQGATANRAQRAQAVEEWQWNRLIKKYGPEDVDNVSFSNPRDIVSSVNNMGARKAEGFMTELQKLNPELHTQVRQTAIDQTRKDLHRVYFDPQKDSANLRTGVQMRGWFDDSKDALKALHGDQYVTDLETIVRASELDARRLVLKGSTPPTQHDLIRVTRSILGPLSKPQRQITAGNYINNKRLAAKVMDIYSDPAMLRDLKRHKGLGAKTAGGIALFVRLGLAEAMGIPSPENVNDPSTWSPEFKQQIADAYDQIDFWSKDSEDEAR